MEPCLERKHDSNWITIDYVGKFSFAGQLWVDDLREKEIGYEFDGVQLKEWSVQVSRWNTSYLNDSNDKLSF